MRGINKNSRNDCFVIKLKRNLGLLAPKPVEMGNNNLTRDKGLACPPLTLIFRKFCLRTIDLPSITRVYLKHVFLYRLTIMHLLCQVAIKSIRKERIVDDLDRIHIQREIEITASLRHPNIIRFHEGGSHIHRENVLSLLQIISPKIKTESQKYLQNCSRLLSFFTSTIKTHVVISRRLITSVLRSALIGLRPLRLLTIDVQGHPGETLQIATMKYYSLLFDAACLLQKTCINIYLYAM